MNKFIGIGRITRDLELKMTQNGNRVVNFTIAIKRNKEESDFINCIAWNQTADFMDKYIGKGDLISVDGKIQTRNYDDADGKKVYVTEVLANAVNILSKKASEVKEVTEAESETKEKALERFLDISDEDLPF